MEKPASNLRIGDKIIHMKTVKMITGKTVTKGLGGDRVLFKFSDGTQQTVNAWSWFTLVKS